MLQEGEANKYYRELNLEKAVATLSYEIQGNRVVYEAFCDINSSVMRIRMRADKPIDLQLSYRVRNRRIVNGRNLRKTVIFVLRAF